MTGSRDTATIIGPSRGRFILPGVLLWMLFASAAAQSATLAVTYNISPGFVLGPTVTGGNLADSPDPPDWFGGLNIQASAYTTLAKDSVQPANAPRSIIFKLYTVTSFANFVGGEIPIEIGSGVDSLSWLLAAGTDYVFSIQCKTDCVNADYTINASAVPLPAAAWLFGSALVGFIMMSNRRSV